MTAASPTKRAHAHEHVPHAHSTMALKQPDMGTRPCTHNRHAAAAKNRSRALRALRPAASAEHPPQGSSPRHDWPRLPAYYYCYQYTPLNPSGTAAPYSSVQGPIRAARRSWQDHKRAAARTKSSQLRACQRRNFPCQRMEALLSESVTGPFEYVGGLGGSRTTLALAKRRAVESLDFLNHTRHVSIKATNDDAAFRSRKQLGCRPQGNSSTAQERRRQRTLVTNGTAHFGSARPRPRRHLPRRPLIGHESPCGTVGVIGLGRCRLH